MAEQLPLDLPLRPALGRSEFAVSSANSDAMRLVEGWETWPQGKLVLYGPEGSGKTHLAHVWADLAGAVVLQANASEIPKTTAKCVVVEDVPEIGGDIALEEALFHLHNRILAQNGRLLLTGQAPPGTWPIALPDLASRMQGTLSVALDPPDEDLLSFILLKLFADRQLTPSPKALATLVLHMERSFAEAGRLVADMDRRALVGRRRISDALAREVLGLSDATGRPLPSDDPEA